MEEKKNFYSNAAILSCSDRDSVITFRLMEPIYDEKNKLIRSEISNEVKIYLSNQHLNALYQIIGQNIDKNKKNESKKEK